MNFLKVERLPKNIREKILFVDQNTKAATNWNGEVVSICYLMGKYITKSGHTSFYYRNREDLIKTIKEEVILKGSK